MCKKLYIVILLIIPLYLSSFSQSHKVGHPFITNYLNNVTKGGGENFDAVQDKYGRMFFGNGQGVLLFNGYTWDLIHVSNQSYVRSLAVDDDNRIYVGAYQEFGYLDIDKNGNYEYHSLQHLIPDSIKDYAEIWKIIVIDKKIYFQSYYCLFEYSNEKLNIFMPETEFGFVFQAHNSLYIEDKELGLFQLRNDELVLVKNGDQFSGKEIRSLIGIGQSELLVGTRNNGIIHYSNGILKDWNKDLNSEIKNDKINCGIPIDQNRFAYGTVQTGIYICDDAGHIQERITHNEGIQEDAIVGLYSDRDKNLWVMTSLGIDYVEVSSAYRVLSSEFGSGYASFIDDDKIYLGTNRGLYINNWPPNYSEGEQDLNLVENTVGQVWCIQEINGMTLLGHHEGAFLIEDSKATKISKINGHWQFFELNDHKGYILSGTYTGFTLFKQKDNKIEFVRKIEGFSESCRISYQDKHGYIWMSHGFKGIYQLKLNSTLDGFDEIKYYNEKNGLPSNLFNDIFLHDGLIYITSEDGIYKYDYNNNLIKKDDLFTSYFDKTIPLSKVLVGPENSLWNFKKGVAGKLTILNDTLFLNDYQTMSFIAKELMPAWETITWDDSENMIVGTQSGFVYFEADQYKKQKEPFITEVSSFESKGRDFDILYGNNKFKSELNQTKIEIPYLNQFIKINVSANFFSNSGSNEYRYKINQFHPEWSSWDQNNIIELPHLKEGEYQLHLESRNYHLQKGAPLTIEFIVLPPWYRTWIAYSIYILLFLAIIGSTYLYIRSRVEKLKFVLTEKQKKELAEQENKIKAEKEQAERELIKLKNDNLASEVIFKSKELANSASNIIHKNQMLIEIKTDLRLMAEESKNQYVQRKIKGLLRKINKDIENDQSHAVYSANFDRVHENFIAEIKNIYPDLTPKDLRLCSYLRMNLSTKEIAPMLNISVRGVEISRYRLRKKLNLSNEENLTEFIMNFKHSN